ncbi:uncharacterized protein LOC129314762 isoform X1 [Prosopis cineraria]|uniref:uncharacterized protein LOC129314762 isoform X1 n=1 Tax=Prosopis cineraria TaxID=364024 RepID=UPI0024107895|nr:uncharacterized protein LOC129314762 isoform X1 [Prosopis cineraria]
MTLANRTEGVTNEALLDLFISGLKPDIRREAITHSPLNLQLAVGLAKFYDSKRDIFSVPSKSKGGMNTIENSQEIGGNSIAASMSNALSSGMKSTLPPLLATPVMKSLNNLKKMSPAEMMIKREKGLCYTCDAKFSLSHRCPNKQYMLIECEDRAPKDDPGGQKSEGSKDDNEELTIHHLSLQACQGKPVAGADVVIGALWLATLGPHVADYTVGQSYIKCCNGDDFLTLLGKQGPTVSQAKLHQFQ